VQVWEGSKLRRGRTIDSSREDRRIHTWDRASGFHGSKSREHCNRNRKIMKCDILTVKGIVWATRVRLGDRWNELSEFCSEKSRNYRIRIRYIANSEMPME
jgi:hypothetical protein